MKRSTISLVVVAAVALAACQKPAETPKAKFETNEQKMSYGMGLQIAKSAPDEFNQAIDQEALFQGIRDGFAKKNPQLSEAEIKTASEAIMKVIEEKIKKSHEAAAAEGKTFLATNAKKAGVITTASGLQYEVLKKTEGKQAKAGETVTVNYKGTLLNGKEFDSSYARNEPATFPLSGVIPGWQEGIPLMKVGEKYKFYIPSELAYGAQSPSPDIPPNSVLVFEVELMDIPAQQAAPQGTPELPAK